MIIDNFKCNIPNITVNKVVDSLALLYENAINQQIELKGLPTPFLWGAAGIGKSQGVRQLADKLQEKTGKKVVVTDVRLLLFSPVDLRGVPMADEHHQFTVWLKPFIFKMDEGEDTINLLFLDELSAAPQSVQAAAYQICLDRKIGEHNLPDNCIVIAAGNRVTDQSVSYKMPKALCNRLMHFNIQSDYMAWRKWAIQHDVAEQVIAYLALDNSRLCVEPEADDLAYCTPRSWEFVSNILKITKDSPESMAEMISACVGRDIATEFIRFCKGTLDMPDINKIFAGKCKEYPRTHDITYVLISSIVARMQQNCEDISITEIENVWKYIQRFPKDFVMVFIKDVSMVEVLNKKMMKCYGFQNWLNSHHVSL
mgnify:CR=1 FL=1